MAPGTKQNAGHAIRMQPYVGMGLGQIFHNRGTTDVSRGFCKVSTGFGDIRTRQRSAFNVRLALYMGAS